MATVFSVSIGLFIDQHDDAKLVYMFMREHDMGLPILECRCSFQARRRNVDLVFGWRISLRIWENRNSEMMEERIGWLEISIRLGRMQSELLE